ncbi:PTS system glucose-specific EIICB component [Paenibacillus sp. P1XP2]|nr:PTS system glucose-specific EIICB component [Paenibacillus sp. P1XP2]
MNWLGSLQQLGRAVILPTMVLPSAAILLSVGSLPWAAWGLPHVAEVCTWAGQGIFYFLPYLFAVGVAGGFRTKPGRRD